MADPTKAMSLIPAEPDLPVTGVDMSPDCRDGKHGSCSGEGFNDATGEIVACPCGCTCRACGEHGANTIVLDAKCPTLVPHQGVWVNGYAVHQGQCEHQIDDERREERRG